VSRRGSMEDPSFGELYRREIGYVWTNLRRLGVPQMSLEDAAHDVFVVVHRRLPHFGGRSTVRTWLFGITRRIASRYRRTEARTQRRRAALAAVVRDEHDLDDAIARKEAGRALEAFLQRLDPRKREAFVLGELERLTRNELGRALGVSPNTAYSRLRAARAEFRRTFCEASPSARKLVLRVARSIEPAPPQSRKRVWTLLALDVPHGVTAGVVTTGLPWGGMIAVGAATVLAVWVGATSFSRASGRDPVASTTRARDRASTSSTSLTPSPELSPLQLAEPDVSRSSPPEREREPTAVRRSGLVTPTRQSNPKHTESAPTPTHAHAHAHASIAEEALLLQQARRALLAGDGREAVVHLDAHADRFPTGALTEERDATRVDALCRIGDLEKARVWARRFAERHPGSAHLEAMRHTCAGPEITLARGGD
jgi:RNA polymerase sigma factor (sigma-70 family)